MGHVTQFWSMRSLLEGFLGMFSLLLQKKKPKTPAISGIWMLLGEKVMLRVVVGVLWPRGG